MISTDKSAAEREAYISWLSTTYPHAYNEEDAKHNWRVNHVSALAWQFRASLPPADTGAVAAHDFSNDFVEHSHPQYGAGFFCTPDVFERITALAAPSAPSASLTTPSKEPAGAVDPSDVRCFLEKLVADNRKSGAMFPQIADEIQADDEAHQRILKLIDFYHPRKDLAAPGAAIDAREQEADWLQFAPKLPGVSSAEPTLERIIWRYYLGAMDDEQDAQHFAKLYVGALRDALASRPEAPPASAPAAEVAQPITEEDDKRNARGAGFRAEDLTLPLPALPEPFIASTEIGYSLHRAPEVLRFGAGCYRLALASSPYSVPAESGWQPKLTVKVRSFPESNGRRNWTALLTREEPWNGLPGNCGGITIERGEFWNRVAYEAERTRYLLGLRDTEPFILDYGDDITTPDEWKGETRAAAPQAVQAGGEGGAA